jgi:nitroimidazol reductase NimA-like FMN-containing flavoprotein (pyridoxamine 5'-phosphate oxidase superfamily)
MRRKDRQINDTRDLEQIIHESDVCRIAFANGNVPYIVTMNFGYEGGRRPCFYFHCAGEGRKLEMIRKNDYVCFALDTGHELYSGENGCDWGMKFRSVVGYGNMSVVTDNVERISGLNSIMSHYAGTGNYKFDESILNNTTILRLDIEEMTAKSKK